jgi:DNA-binding SARP family transcriptional activator
MIELLTLGRVRLATGDAGRTLPSGQPKRVALLAYLAVNAGRAGRRRDELVAAFWPELDEEDARSALRQALHYLRRVLGNDVLRTEGEEVAVITSALRCDAVAFEQLAIAGRTDEALALYGGDFLQGFFVPEVSAEFEAWVDSTRVRLRRRAAAAAWLAADTAEKAADPARAVQHARRACELELDAEDGWRQLMLIQDRAGDRAGALRSYAMLSQRLEREFGARPAAETTAVAEAIRRRARALDVPVVSVIPSPAAALLDADLSMPSSVHSVPPVPSTPPARPAPRERSWTISRRSLAALLVVAGIGAGAAAVRATHDERRDRPSLVSAGSIAASGRVIVADFADRAGDSLLAGAVTQALRIDLGESPLVKVLSARQLQSALLRMQRPPTEEVDDSVAREIALREGAKAIVVGSVARVGAGYTIAAQILSSERGEQLTAVRESARDSAELVVAVDRVSKALRYRIGESLRDLRGATPLEHVTTASLPALRAYTQGYRLFVDGHRTEALRSFKEAIARDTGFALAWRSMAALYEAMGEPGRQMDAGRHAMANVDRLPDRERDFLLAGHAYGSGDYETAIRAYQRYLARYPREAPALSNMALAYRDWRRYAKAESLYALAIAADSGIPVIWYGLHSAEALQGRLVESRRTLDEIARRFPNDGVLSSVEVEDAVARQDWDAAERRAEANIAAHQSDTLQLVDAFEATAGIVETRGRLGDAERYWRTQLRLSEASGSSARHLAGTLQLALLELRYHHRRDRARLMMDSAIRRRPLEAILPGDRAYYALSRFYAAAGDPARARVLLAAGDENERMLGHSQLAERGWTLGVIALATGRGRDAEAELREAAETHVCAICVLPDLARAYEAVGKRDAALIAWERYADTPWLWRQESDATELGFALRRVAELLESAGEGERSAAAYARLARLWEHADAELQPVVADARRHVSGR